MTYLMTPFILTDKSRLQEIYELRVVAWENSDLGSSINKASYPNGWNETIDGDAYHFVITNELNKIIASARISLHNNIDELPYPHVFNKFSLPPERPFAFYSRLVVSPAYRGNHFSKKLDIARIDFLKENNIPFTIATCRKKRLNSMLNNGFMILGMSFFKLGVGEQYVLILTQDKIGE